MDSRSTSRGSAPGRPSPLRRQRMFALVVIWTVTASCGSDGLFESRPTEAANGVNDASARVIGIGAGSENAPGTRLIVPPGAIDDTARLLVSARSAPLGTWELSQQELAALTKLAMEGAPATGMHPIRTPLAIAASGLRAEAEFVLEPDGTVFARPVLLEIPAYLVPVAEDETLLALLSSSDGSVEVITDVNRSSDTVTVPIPHFSTVKLLSIPVNALGVLTMGLDTAAIDHAAQLVGPTALKVGAEMVSVQCARGDRVMFDESRMPSYFDLLNNLARLEGSLANVSFYEEDELEQWLHGIRNQGLPSVSVAEIYEKALEISNEDAFQALVVAHEVLRNDRLDKRFSDLVTDVRGDGTDELGARYHLFGTAIYGFWYEYRMDHPDAGNNDVVVSPEMAAAYEEALVSGDIDTDAGEFMVDLAGSRIGRDLYQAITASGSTDGAGSAHPCVGVSGSSSSTTTIGVSESSSSTTTIIQAKEPFPWTYEGTFSTHTSVRMGFGARDSIEVDNERQVTITLYADGTVDGTLAAGRVVGVGAVCDTNPPPGTLSTYEVDVESIHITGTHSDGVIRIAYVPQAPEVEGSYTASQIQARWVSGGESPGCSDFPEAGNLQRDGTAFFSLERISPPAP